MSVVKSFKDIYKGSFNQYLRLSEKIGGIVDEQSKLVEVLFLLEINLLDVAQKYKKPIHEQEQNIFTEPIINQIARIKKFRIENNSTGFTSHLELISESIDIFDWINHSNINEFLEKFKIKIAPNISKLRDTLLEFDTTHADWLSSWNQCVEDIAYFLGYFFKDGLIWVGNENVPAQVLLGDIQESYRKFDHSALFQEINQGENITRILRQHNTNNEQIHTDE